MKRLFTSLIILVLSVAPSFALSDAEYLYMKKNDPDYARAEQRLTRIRIWNELKQSMPASAFNELKKEQLAWIKGGRDEDTEIYIERNYSRVEAYTMVTEARAEYLKNKLQIIREEF